MSTPAPGCWRWREPEHQARLPSSGTRPTAGALPLSDAAFDLVLCQQGLQFFADKLGATREMRRVLAPGGRVALSVWQTLVSF